MRTGEIKGRFIAVLFILVFGMTGGADLLKSQQWTQTNGPYGGNVRTLAVSGTNLYAGTTGGIFLSTDNGTNWTPVNTGLTRTDISALVSSGANLYAGTGNGVFLSTNNGASWTAVNTGLTNPTVHALAVSGTNLYAGTHGGVFLSTNNGTSWTAVNSGLTNSIVLALAVIDTNLFAGTYDGGVFLSTDNGTSWAAVNTGLTYLYVRAFAVSGTKLFVGTGNGVFLSTNNGTSWTAVNTGLTNTIVYALAVSGTNLFAGTFGGGVFLSTNNGTSWTAANTGLTSTLVFAFAASGTNLFAGTEAGVFLSTNNGTSWIPVNTGLASTEVRSLATKGTDLFAAAQGEAFLSTNNGTSWTAVNSGLTGSFVKSFAFSDTNLFVGTSIRTNGGGVFLSTNNGTSWNPVNTGLTNTNVLSLAVSDTNLFAGTNGGGVFRSTNNGTSWTAVNTGLTNMTVSTLAVSGANLYAAGTTGGGVFHSTDNGESWTAVNTGLTNTIVYALAVSGTNLFAGTFGGGVFLSTNNGTSWTAANTGLTSTLVFAFAASGTNLFAGTEAGVFLSTNNGTSWTAVNTGLTNASVWSLTVSGTNVFAGTNAYGVFINSISVLVPPTSPQNLTATTGNNQVTLKWRKNTEQDLIRYRIYQSTSPNASIQVDSTTGGSDTTRILTGLSAGTMYYFRVSAVNSAGNVSPYSAEVNAVPLDPVAPNISVAVLQNPALSKYFDLVVVSRSSLSSLPFVKVWLDGSTDTTTLDMATIGGSPLVYAGPGQFDTSGVYSFRVKVTSTGGTDTIRTVTYGVILAKPGAITKLIASDNNASLEIGAKAVHQDVYFVSHLEKSLNEAVYQFGPANMEFTEPLDVEIAYDPANYPESAKLFISRKVDEEWQTLPSQVYPSRQTVKTKVTQLGEFKIVYDATFAGNNVVPTDYALSQNYPNPFNPSTTIRYDLPEDGFLTIKIYNLLGQEVRALVSGDQTGGMHSVLWDGRNNQGQVVASGIYLYRLHTKQFTQTKKMLFIK